MNLLLWALGIAGFLVNADNRSIAPLLPAIADDLMIRESSAGLLVSAYSIPYGLFQLIYGPIADRIGKLRTISIALVFFSLGTVACSFTDSFNTLLALRVMNGIFAAGIIPATIAHIGDSVPFEKRTAAIAFFMSFCMSGQALGIVFGSMLAQFFSWKTLFLIVGLTGFGVSMVFLLRQSATVRLPVPPQASLLDRYRKIFRGSRAWIVYGSVCLEGMLLFGGFTYLGVYANRILGLDYFQIGLLTAGFSVAAFGGTWFVPRIIRRVGQHRMPLLGSIILTAAFSLIWLITDWRSLCGGFFLLGVGYILLHTSLQTYATELLPESRGICVSLFAFFLFLGNGLGPILFGLFYDWNGAGGMLAAATGCLVLFTFFCQVAFRHFDATGSNVKVPT